MNDADDVRRRSQELSGVLDGQHKELKVLLQDTMQQLERQFQDRLHQQHGVLEEWLVMSSGGHQLTNAESNGSIHDGVAHTASVRSRRMSRCGTDLGLLPGRHEAPGGQRNSQKREKEASHGCAQVETIELDNPEEPVPPSKFAPMSSPKRNNGMKQDYKLSPKSKPANAWGPTASADAVPENTTVHETSIGDAPLSAVRRAASRASTIPASFNKLDRFMSWKDDYHRTSKQNLLRETPSQLRTFVRSGAFRTVCSLMIVFNTAFMGFKVHYELHSLIKERQMPADIWEQVELAFSCWFLLELLLRVVAEKLNIFNKDEVLWNLFDAFLVSLSVVDAVMWLNRAPQAVGVNLGFTRILRIFRFARLLRLIRVMRFFYSFRVMVYSIIGSMVSLMWVFLVLFFVIFAFTMFFLNGVAGYFEEKISMIGVIDDASDALAMNFGSMDSALFALFMAISGGKDWEELWRPLVTIHEVYGLVFILYIFFLVFGILNVVNATFVDSAAQISKNDREIVTQTEKERTDKYARQLREFFHEADANNSGSLSWEEFRSHLEDKRVEAYFQSFELDVSQAGALFKMLDRDDSDDVGIDEFINGCKHLKGQARSIDVNMLLYENEKIHKTFNKFMRYVEEQFDLVRKALRAVGAPYQTESPSSRTAAHLEMAQAQNTQSGYSTARQADGWV